MLANFVVRDFIIVVVFKNNVYGAVLPVLEMSQIQFFSTSTTFLA